MAGAGAKRYARAVFELAREEGQVDRWARTLATLQEVLSEPRAHAVLANPSIASERREEAATALLADRVEPEGVNLAKLLVAAGRVDDLGAIIEEYGRLADEDAGRVRARAITAVPLSPADADALAASLKRRLGRDVRVEPSVDPAVIGGMVLRIGDRVIDASVATRLRLLRTQLAGATTN